MTERSNWTMESSATQGDFGRPKASRGRRRATAETSVANCAGQWQLMLVNQVGERRMNTKAILLSAFAAASVFASAPSSFANVVFSQPGDGTACATSCWTSSGPFQTFASFSVSSAAAIQTVQFQGFYYDYGTTSNNPVAPVTTSWDITFWSDASGSPGSELYSSTPSSVNTVYLGESIFGSPVYVYSVTATLTTAFDASAGTDYWFSPYSVQPSGTVIFSWSPSAAAGTATMQNVNGGAPNDKPDSRAFVLSTVPEPSTWAMGLLGFAGLGLVAARRARRMAFA